MLVRIPGVLNLTYKSPRLFLLFMLRYFNDLWVYDLEEMEWRCEGKTGATGPSPRGEILGHSARASNAIHVGDKYVLS